MGKEIRLFGPPGTGKTTRLSSWIGQAAEKYGSDRIFAASFTKTAATELVERKLPVAKEQVGTLHAHCYRALGHVEIAETKIAEWNEEHPSLVMGHAEMGLDDPQGESSHGVTKVDEAMGRAEVLRARLVPIEQWFGFTKEIYTEWCAWKNAHNYLDFTDLIEHCLRDVDRPKGNPDVGFLDEVQDFTPLELSLVRKWCADMEYYVLAGDDDQTLYSFKGATPDAWLFPELPADQIRVLGQSYRVPGAVHEYAQGLTRCIKTRQPKEYLPTVERGALNRCRGSFKNPRPIVQEVEERIGRGQTCMVLAACSYMLNGILAELRKAGIPFFNPYRRKRGDWNPLARGGQKKHTALDRLSAFLAIDPEARERPQDQWTWGDIALWAEPLESKGLFRDGFKTAVRKMDQVATPDPWDLAAWIDSAALAEAYNHDLEWFCGRLLATKRKPYEAAVSVALHRGKRALMEPSKDRRDWPPGTVPWVTVGTIHSVKGGESDVVFLMPDISQRGYMQWLMGDEGRDSIVRQFYVGATRARQELVLCAPATRTAFQSSLGWMS